MNTWRNENVALVQRCSLLNQLPLFCYIYIFFHFQSYHNNRYLRNITFNSAIVTPVKYVFELKNLWISLKIRKVLVTPCPALPPLHLLFSKCHSSVDASCQTNFKALIYGDVKELCMLYEYECILLFFCYVLTRNWINHLPTFIPINESHIL